MKVDFLTSGLENFLNQSMQLNEYDEDDRPPIQMDYGMIENRKE